MKKVLRRWMTALMCILFAALPMATTGCGKTPAGTLTISFTIAGYGDEYVPELCEAFTAETGIPVDIKLDDNNTNTNISRITSTNRNEIDLFFTMVPSFNMIDSYRNRYGYDNLFQDLTELYAREVPGTGKTLLEKVRPDLYDAQLTMAGEIYSVPWTTSIEGFMYNRQVLDLYKIEQLPRTTDEFEEVLDVIKSGKATDGTMIAPIQRAAGITCANNSAYWSFVWPTWWAQYEGIDKYEQYFSALPDGATVPDWQMLDQRGKLIAIEETKRFIDKNNGYMYAKCADTSHLQAQVDFFDGKAAFIPSGQWIENETASDFYAEGKTLSFGMMRTPVTSRLGEKLGIDEDALRDTVDYVDGVTDEAPVYTGKSAEESAAVLAAVREARSLVSSTLTEQNKAYVASYAKEKEEAYQFLLFYASDKGQEILTRYGILSAFGYRGGEKLSPFMQSLEEIVYGNQSRLCMKVDRYPIVYKAGLNITAHTNITSATRGFEKLLYDGAASPTTIYNDDLLYYQTQWNKMLLDAGYGRQ